MFNAAPLLAFLILSTTALADPIKVTVKTVKGSKWNAKTLELVQKAATIAFQELSRFEVANCAYRNTTRGKYSKDKVRQIWGNQIPVINKSRKVSIVIHKEKMPENIRGRARVGIGKVDKKVSAITNLEISLNQETLNKHVKTYSKNTSSDEIINKWVSVIAHEVAHNLGHSHGSSGNWSNDYPGYFVSEIGFCAMTKGKFGSDLGVRRRR
jgi:hypothetical protein